MKRYIPIAIIILLMLLFYLTGWYKALDFTTLRYHHVELRDYVTNYPLMTPFLFMGIYIFATALSIPGGIILSLIGGYLFPQPLCTIYVVISATIGATLLFLSARTAFGDFLKKRAGKYLAKMQKGFQESAVNYMLFLRLVPLFPFWLVNLAPAFFNVRLSTYIWTTLVGITPAAFVFTQAGRGLNAIFESHEEFSINAIFNIELKIALISLGIFALIPVIIKKLRKKKHD